MHFKIKTSLVGGSLATIGNLRRLLVYSNNLCQNVISPAIDPKTYRETYVLLREGDLFRFREITHGMGGGQGKNVAGAVKHACRCFHVELLENEIPQEVFDRTAQIVAWNENRVRQGRIAPMPVDLMFENQKAIASIRIQR